MKGMKGTQAYEAIVLGLGAIQYMAARLESSRRTFDLMNRLRPDETAAEIIANDVRVLRLTAEKVDAAMQLLGDFLSNCDAVDENDEAATNHAFAFMRKFLSGKSSQAGIVRDTDLRDVFRCSICGTYLNEEGWCRHCGTNIFDG